MDYVIVNNIVKRFKKAEVLHRISLTLEQGKIYGIVGNNGSGKTVLMKCICGFLPVTSGEILVNGKRVGRDVDFPDSLGVIIETPGFLSNLTGRKNLEILAQLKGRIGRKEINKVMRQVGLDPELKKKVSEYSLGMRQRLGIAQAIMEDPDLLILDEPFNGLDKHGVAEIRKLILSWKGQGKTILLASHNGEDIQVLCDVVYEMDAGRLMGQTDRENNGKYNE